MCDPTREERGKKFVQQGLSARGSVCLAVFCNSPITSESGFLGFMTFPSSRWEGSLRKLDGTRKEPSLSLPHLRLTTYLISFLNGTPT